MPAWRIGLLILLGSLCGCSVTRGKPFDPGLVGRQFYLCCNMGFNPRFEASDSNYGQYTVGSHLYSKGPMLPAGTRVTVVEVGASGIAFRPEGSQTNYTLSFGYGKTKISPKQYFDGILRQTNPMDAQRDVSLAIARGMRDGQLVHGMTKQQALIARGYPPAHQTPDLDSNEWLYYETPGFADRVVFVDGRIQSVTRGPAPQ